MAKQRLQPKSLWVPKAPYSQGFKKGQFVFTAGQDARDSTGNLVGIGDIAAQAEQCLKNLQAVLAEGEASLDDVVKCLVFLSDIRHFEKMNEVADKVNAAQTEFFPNHAPTATMVGVTCLATDPRCKIEVRAIAVIDDRT